MLRVGNLALKFLLELSAFAALAYWGATAATAPWSVVLAIVAPGAAIVGWGVFAAPKSAHRLPAVTRIPFELAVFALAVVALLVAGAPVAATALAVLVVISAVLLTVHDAWDA